MYNSSRNKPIKNKYAGYNEKNNSSYNVPNNGQNMNNNYQSNYNNQNMYGYDEYMNFSDHASNGMQKNNNYDRGYNNSNYNESYNYGNNNNSNYRSNNGNSYNKDNSHNINNNYGVNNYNNNYDNYSYSNDNYNNNNYGNYSYSNDNYSNNNYNKNSYSNNNYSNNNYSNNNYNKDSYSNDNYSNNSYSKKNGYSNDNYTTNNYSKNSYAETGHANTSYNNINYENPSYKNLSPNKNEKSNQYSDSGSTYSSNYAYTTYDKGDYDNTVYGDNENGITSEREECEITVQTPAKSHTVMEAVFRIILYIFIGVLAGNLLSGPFSSFWKNYVDDKNVLSKIINVVVIILVVLISYLIHIILHELGHLIGGTLTNYSLISFRVFSIVLTKENKKTKIKKYSVPNSVGECVMMPPEVKKGNYPYKMYRIGGIAMNLVTAIISLVLVFGIDSLSKYPWNMWGFIYGAVGIITAIFNGIPVVVGGVPNDGYILLHMTESKEASLAMHSQLLIHAFLSKGGTYSEVPYEQFCISKSGEIKNFLVARVKLLEYKWHVEHLDFTQAAKCLEATNQYFNSLPKIYQYEINSEKLFIEIMTSNDKDVIDKLFNSDVERFLLEFQNVLSRNRIMMAYEAGVKRDTRAAHKHYMQLKNNVKIYPIKGEASLELILSDYIYEKFCSNSHNVRMGV